VRRFLSRFDFARRTFFFTAAIALRSFLIFAFEHAAFVHATSGPVRGKPTSSWSSELNVRVDATCPSARNPVLASATLGLASADSTARQAMTISLAPSVTSVSLHSIERRARSM
jgi:hypothetical protein